MRNRWIAFLTVIIAVIAVLFAHGEWGGAYVERESNRLFEANARETLRTINIAAAVWLGLVNGTKSGGNAPAIRSARYCAKMANRAAIARRSKRQ